MIYALALSSTAFQEPSAGRAAELTMFGGGKKVAIKKGAKKGPSVSKVATSATGRTSSFIDVTGNAYVEVDTFTPKFDEIGVLPPLGRWDPLQIREQGPERYRRFVEMEIKHGRMSMAAVTGVLVTYSGMRWPGYLSTSEGIKFSDIPGGAIKFSDIP